MNKFFTLIFLAFWLLAADWVVGQEMVLVKEDINSLIVAQELVNDKWFFFEAESMFSSTPDLWVTDGTQEGTNKLLEDNVFMFRSTPHLYMGSYQGMLYFAGTDTEHGVEVWRSDGTVAGTKFFADLAEGMENSHPAGFVELNGYLYVWAYIKKEDGTNFSQVWRTDGTNFEMIKEISVCENTFLDYEFTLKEYTVNQDAILFTLGGELNGSQFCLWKTDGTSEGTLIVTETTSDGPGGLITADNDISYFAAIAQVESIGSNFLWRSDGTALGTYPLESAYKTRNRTILGNSLYYVRRPGFGSTDNEIWKTNGDIPTLVKSAPSDAYLYSDLLGFDNKLFFVFEDEEHGIELWVSNGSESGTHIFQDVNTGVGNSQPRHLTVIGENLYFIANYSDENHGLYRVVGETTEQLIDFGTTDIVDTQGLFPFGEDKILLLNRNSENVNQLWLYSPLIDNIEENVFSVSIEVHPNPFDKETLLAFPESLGKQVSLNVYTTIGQKVSISYDQTKEGILLKRADLETGMYFFELREGDIVLGNGKLLIE